MYAIASCELVTFFVKLFGYYNYSYLFRLFMNYLCIIIIIIIIIGKALTCVLRHVRGILSSIELEMPLKSSSPLVKMY